MRTKIFFRNTIKGSASELYPFRNVKNKTICAYNGSGFDFHILLNHLKDKGVDIRNFKWCNIKIYIW